MYEKRDGDMVLFRKYNATGKQPNMTGEALINGVTYEIALWTKNGSRGEFWAGNAKPKDAKRTPYNSYGAQSKTDQVYRPDPDNSDIPF